MYPKYVIGGIPAINNPAIFNPATGTVAINPLTGRPFPLLDPETTEAITSLYGWSGQVQLSDRASTDGPSLAVAGELSIGGPTIPPTVYMAWKGTDGDSGLYFASSPDGTHWSAQQTVDGVGSSDGPALATYSAPPRPDGTPRVGLIMAWKGTHDDHNIYWAVNPDRQPQGWSGQKSIDVGTSARPTLATYSLPPAPDGTPRIGLCMAWKGTKGDSGIYWSQFDGVSSWSPQKQIVGRGTSHGPTLVYFNGQLHMFWKGIDDDHNVWYAVLVDPGNGIWGPQELVQYVDAGDLDAGQTPIPIATSNGPAATVRGDEIILAWKGVPGDHTLWFSRFKNGSFSGQMSVANVGSETGPGIVDLNGQLVLGWRGIGPDHTLYISTLG